MKITPLNWPGGSYWFFSSQLNDFKKRHSYTLIPPPPFRLNIKFPDEEFELKNCCEDRFHSVRQFQKISSRGCTVVEMSRTNCPKFFLMIQTLETQLCFPPFTHRRTTFSSFTFLFLFSSTKKILNIGTSTEIECRENFSGHDCNFRGKKVCDLFKSRRKRDISSKLFGSCL